MIAATHQEKLVELLLFSSRLNDIVFSQFSLTKIGENFALLAYLRIAVQAFLALKFQIVKLLDQNRMPLLTDRLAERRKPEFRPRDALSSGSERLSMFFIGFPIERLDFVAQMNHLRGDRPQPVQLGFFEGLAQPQKRFQREMECHRLSGQCIEKPDRLIDRGLIVLLLLQERLNRRQRQEGFIQNLIGPLLIRADSN
jgi:hypothetical protein